MHSSSTYRGRFAPSPSGPLHFGSLVSAVTSFLQARSKDGQWLLRIEDIDPPREVVGASDLIIQTLDNYGLHWDGTITYQSQRLELYQAYLEQLKQNGYTFNCKCTRAMLKPGAGLYPGTCISLNLADSKNTSTRFKSASELTQFHDQLLGEVKFDTSAFDQNFILKRKDGLFAYQLAVVVDDMLQNITEIVRGIDLLDSTPRQIQLFRSFNTRVPDYLHHPLVKDANGLKLCKQYKAPSVDLNNPLPSLLQALEFLGQKPPPQANFSSPEEVLNWAIKNWQLTAVPHQ